MKENLVIVESPAKAKTIEKFLGKDYTVLSSYGHIRDLKKHSFSIDIDTFSPVYEIPTDKAKVVAQLKKAASEASTVWLASDEDREGEAISWHLSEVLHLSPEHTRRIVFHEITKSAILNAIDHPRNIDLNLVNAQQARRVLDRIVGFKLSPVLWRRVKPSLSAGRVQSVAVRLIVDREREIQLFQSEDNYRVIAVFTTPDGSEIRAELSRKFTTREQAEDFLKRCRGAEFTVQDITTKPQKRVPAPPFTTSTLQQEAAHRLGFTVAQTMTVAQRLYESGRITYMRTDSVNLSDLCLNASKKVITEQMGEQYVKIRHYHTHSKGAQEAHEAIRPTYMDQTHIEGTLPERRLYELIWKRSIASQMADAEIEKTQVVIGISGQEETFVAMGEVVKFDGFLSLYRDAQPQEDENAEERSAQLPETYLGEMLTRQTVTATQRFSQHPPRYNEASLVRKLEELGIGRPSTYATTITTIQQREYVTKGDKPGDTHDCLTLVLQGDDILASTSEVTLGAERARLVPTDVGTVVNDFLLENFPSIMDYNFTADVEKEFDEIAEGRTEWTHVISDFYANFNPMVEQSLKMRGEHRVGERMLGDDPKTGFPVSVKIGRFGPVVQIGNSELGEKPRFAQLKKEQSIDTITLEEALDLFRLPRLLGEHEGHEVTVASGRYGPYVACNGMFASLPKGTDPMAISFDEAIRLIVEKQQAEQKRQLKTFAEAPDLEILNGRYGPYINYKGANYRLPKSVHEHVSEITLEECMKLIHEQQDKETGEKPAAKRRYFPKKKQ